MPKVSVIIPVYNGAKYIEECLVSVIQQSFKDFELIVINDGSTDRTKKILEEFKEFAKIINYDVNCGISSTLNNGIKNASGDYICFLAADDIWHGTKLETDLDYIMNTKYGVVYSDFYQLSGEEIKTIFLREYDPDILRRKCFINISSSMIKKIYLDQLRDKDGYCFDDTLRSAMDWDLWIRLSQLCNFKHIPICLSYYRIHPDQTIARKFHIRDRTKVYYRYNTDGCIKWIHRFVKDIISMRGRDD